VWGEGGEKEGGCCMFLCVVCFCVFVCVRFWLRLCVSVRAPLTARAQYPQRGVCGEGVGVCFHVLCVSVAMSVSVFVCVSGFLRL